MSVRIRSIAAARSVGVVRPWREPLTSTPVPRGFVRMQGVAWAGAALAQQSIRVRGPDDGQAVLRLGVADRVAAGERPACLADLGRRAPEHLRQHVAWQLLGERRDRQGEEDAATHREHVAHRVRGRDLAEGPRVVDERREEVDRADDREVVADAIGGRIVGWLEPGDQLVRSGLRAQTGERLGQQVGTELRRAPAAIGEARSAAGRGRRTGSSWADDRRGAARACRRR